MYHANYSSIHFRFTIAIYLYCEDEENEDVLSLIQLLFNIQLMVQLNDYFVQLTFWIIDSKSKLWQINKTIWSFKIKLQKELLFVVS